MADYQLVVVSGEGRGKIQSKTTTMDLAAINLGSTGLAVTQGGVGGTAWFEFSARALRSSFVPADNADLVNLLALRTAIAGMISGATWKDPVITLISAPPVAPTLGDRYIIPSTPIATGVFATHEKEIATFNGTVWTFEIALPGWTLRVLDRLNQIWQFEATDWGYGQYESTTASKGCLKSGFDIRRDDTENFENDDLSAIAADLVAVVNATGKINLAGKASAIDDNTSFVFTSVSIDPATSGKCTIRTGGTIEGLTGLVPSKSYYLKTNGQIDLFANITYAIGEKVVRVLKTYATGVAVFCPSYEYTVLS